MATPGGTRPPTAGPAGGTPTLATKLGITPGATLVLVDVPDGLLDGAPPVTVRHRAGGRADLALICCRERRVLARRLDPLARTVFPDGGLWVAWPKRASGGPTDLDDHAVRALALPRGLVDNKVCALDATWTALRLVWRVERRRAP